MKKVKQVDKGEPVRRTEGGKAFVEVGNAKVFLRGKFKRDKVEKKKGDDKEE